MKKKYIVVLILITLSITPFILNFLSFEGQAATKLYFIHKEAFDNEKVKIKSLFDSVTLIKGKKVSFKGDKTALKARDELQRMSGYNPFALLNYYYTVKLESIDDIKRASFGRVKDADMNNHQSVFGKMLDALVLQRFNPAYQRFMKHADEKEKLLAYYYLKAYTEPAFVLHIRHPEEFTHIADGSTDALNKIDRIIKHETVDKYLPFSAKRIAWYLYMNKIKP